MSISASVRNLANRAFAVGDDPATSADSSADDRGAETVEPDAASSLRWSCSPS